MVGCRAGVGKSQDGSQIRGRKKVRKPQKWGVCRNATGANLWELPMAKSKII